MRIHLKFIVFLATIAIWTAPGKSRAETLEPMDLHLVMSMAGVTAGSLMLSIDPKDDRIVSLLKMKSKGLFKFLTGYKSRAEGQSTSGIDGEGPMPVSYDSTYETKKTERKVLIRYDTADGRITRPSKLETGQASKKQSARRSAPGNGGSADCGPAGAPLGSTDQRRFPRRCGCDRECRDGLAALRNLRWPAPLSTGCRIAGAHAYRLRWQ